MAFDEAEKREEIRRVRLDEDLPVDDCVLNELIDAWCRARSCLRPSRKPRGSDRTTCFRTVGTPGHRLARDHGDSYTRYYRAYEKGSPTLVAAFVGPPHALHGVGTDEAKRAVEQRLLELALQRLTARRTRERPKCRIRRETRGCISLRDITRYHP